MEHQHEKTSPLNILFSHGALSFINKRGLTEHMILVNLIYRAGGGGCSGGPSTPTPHASVIMVEGVDPGEGFERVETRAGVPIYMAKPLFEAGKRAGNPLMLNVSGVWMFKRLKLEGLDLSPLRGTAGDQGEASCH